MKALQHHISGIKATFETLARGKMLVFLIPGAVIGLIYYISAHSLSSAGDEMAKSTEDWWLVGSALSSTIKGAFGFLDTVLLFIFQFIILTALSPFNTMLSEKFDTELTGNTFRSGIVRFINDLLRAVLIAIIAILLQLIFTSVWWILSWILPFSDLLDPVMYFLINAFFFGLAFYDYSLERYEVGTLGSLGFAFSRMLYMLMTGAVFSAIFAIPYIGIILAPVLTTMIATGTYLQMKPKVPAAPDTIDTL